MRIRGGSQKNNLSRQCIVAPPKHLWPRVSCKARYPGKFPRYPQLCSPSTIAGTGDLKILRGIIAHPADVVLPKRIAHQTAVIAVRIARGRAAAVGHVQIVPQLVHHHRGELPIKFGEYGSPVIDVRWRASIGEQFEWGGGEYGCRTNKV